MMRRQKRYVTVTLGLLLLALVGVGCQQTSADRARSAAAAQEASSTTPSATSESAPAPSNEPVAGPTPASIASADNMMVRGDPDAPVTIVEFSDYQCPFCASYVSETWPKIESELIDTGRVRYVFKDYPLAALHPKARQAHVAARCAGEQGSYWPMHERLFEQQSRWGGSSDPAAEFEALAVELGLNAEGFEACLQSDQWGDAVDADLAEGARLGVRGTPTFFVDGYPLVGARSFEFFEQVVELAEEGTLGQAYQRSE